MRLADLLVDQGRRLFKLRSQVPLALLPVVFLAVPQSAATEQWLGPRGSALAQWTAIGVGLVGLLMRCWVVGYAPDGTSARDTRGMRAAQLNSTGVYSIVRHPLYLANGLLWLGAVLSARVWWSPVIAFLAYWIYIERVMLGEEEFLNQTFGDAFRSWAAVTPAIVPSLSRWRPMTGARWQWKRMSSEHNALLALASSVLLFDFLSHWWAGSPAFAPFYAQHPDLVWFWGMAASFSVIAIVARRLPSNR
jgi:protein-S-isoprenylcysteine O-methyltransferase Ste14